MNRHYRLLRSQTCHPLKRGNGPGARVCFELRSGGEHMAKIQASQRLATRSSAQTGDDSLGVSSCQFHRRIVDFHDNGRCVARHFVVHPHGHCSHDGDNRHVGRRGRSRRGPAGGDGRRVSRPPDGSVLHGHLVHHHQRDQHDPGADGHRPRRRAHRLADHRRLAGHPDQCRSRCRPALCDVVELHHRGQWPGG
jgi:hypothetical protein